MENVQQFLINEAIKARKNSYSIYSHFAVGAALLCKDDVVYHGANIENAAYGLAMCAERNAIFRAYSDGKRQKDIVALAVVADTDQPTSPCGACRQVISELLEKGTPIYLTNLKGDVLVTTPEKLLPMAFEPKDLE